MNRLYMNINKTERYRIAYRLARRANRGRIWSVIFGLRIMTTRSHVRIGDIII